MDINRDNLPGIIGNLTDGNLDTTRRSDLGDIVLIIGTAARGPVNQPVKITSPQAAAEMFGDISSGNLVRGFSEVYYGPNGEKDIRLCRISNGRKAKLVLKEGSSTNIEMLPTYLNATAVDAITLEALYPGDIYNDISLRIETAAATGLPTIYIVNPVTNVEVGFTFDPSGTREGAVYDLNGLVNAINNNANLAGIMKATLNEISTSASLTLKTADLTAGVFLTDLSGTISLDLGGMFNAADINDDGYTDTNQIVSPSGVQVTSGNRLLELTSVYENSKQLVELDAQGMSSIELEYPVQASGTLYDLAGNVSGSGKAIHIVTDSYIGEGDGTTKLFQWTAYEAVDPAVFVLKRTSSAGTTVVIPASEYTLTSVGGSVNQYLASVTIKTTSIAPEKGMILTVTYNTAEFALTKTASLQACKATSSYKSYFLVGNKITFGTAQPSDIKICYPAKKTYDIGVDVVIEDALDGEILFGNPDKQPAITAAGTVIYIAWKYQPEWVSLSSAVSLKNGSNGITMNNSTKYNLLDDCYEALADYVSDCVVIMNTYVDDTKIVYDDETGLPVEVNAGFAQQFEDYLESLTNGVNETYGMMSVKPATSTKLADMATWYDKLVNVDITDSTRAANVMATGDFRHINILAFEPVINNASAGMPYTVTGEAIYAGLACKLDITQALTNKTLGNQVLGCRFSISTNQANDLTGMRYVTAKSDNDGIWRITDAMTGAKAGSDYSRFSTLKITFAAMDIVRTEGKPFIGNLFNPARKAALNTAIQRGLLELKTRGALRDFNFKIEQSDQDRILGTANIPLALSPEFELRRIITNVSLNS